MRFRIGPPPESPDFHPAVEGWTRLREPGVAKLFLIALPVGVVLFFATLLLAVALIGREAADVNFPWLIALIVASAPLHEFCHALFLPGIGFSPRTVFGCWPSKVAFYVYHDAPLSRNRHLMVLAGPLVLLTLVPLIVSGFLHATPFIVLHLAFANAIASCADVSTLPIVLFQAPKGAAMRFKGTETWWTGESRPE